MSISPNLTAAIENRAGTAQGEGPLVNVPGVTYWRTLNAAGGFLCSLPLEDERVDYVAAKTTVLRFYLDGVEKFVGVVESIGAAIEQDGTLWLPVSGRCLAAELAEAKVGFLSLDDGASAGVLDGPNDIMVSASLTTPSAWTLDSALPGYTTTSTLVYAKFAGESALAALRLVGEKIGENFRIGDTGRTVVWLRAATPDSGVRALPGAGDMVAAESNPDICFYTSLHRTADAYDMANKIYPYGGGNLDLAVTLAASSKSAGAGFTLDKANNYLQSDTAISALGHTIPVYMQFPDIRPISNTSADLASAADALYEAALAWLSRRDEVTDFITYSLGGILQLPPEVKVGTTLRVIHDDPRLTIDASLVVLEIETTISPDGAQAHRLTVAATDKVPANSTDDIVTNIEQGYVFQAHPLLNVNSYEVGLTKFIYDDGATQEDAYIYFDFDSEVLQVQQCVLKFETNGDIGGGTIGMLPLESTVVSASSPAVTSGASSKSTADADGSINVTSGASSTSSSAGGASHSHGVASPGSNFFETPVYHDGGSAGDNVTYDHGAGRFVYTGSDVGTKDADTYSETAPYTATSDAESTHTHGIDHTHNVTASTHGHGMDHTHSVTASITPVYGVYRELQANTFNKADLTYYVNGAGPYNFSTDAVVLAGNRYQLDITAKVSASTTTFRPNQTNNTLRIIGTNSGGASGRRSCTLDGVLKIRTIIQSTAVT